jgi:hypothetical protein
MLEEIMDNFMGFLKNRFTIGKHAEKILNSLENNPGDWKRSCATIDHKSGLRIWVSNTFFFTDLWPSASAFNLAEKWKIYWYVTLKWKNETIIEKVVEKLGD